MANSKPQAESRIKPWQVFACIAVALALAVTAGWWQPPSTISPDFLLVFLGIVAALSVSTWGFLKTTTVRLGVVALIASVSLTFSAFAAAFAFEISDDLGLQLLRASIGFLVAGLTLVTADSFMEYLRRLRDSVS